MSDESIRILEMVAQGKLSPEDGARLLRALDPKAQDAGGGARFVVIRVMDMDSDRVHVNVRLPLNMAGKLLKFAKKFTNDVEIDTEELYLAIKDGEPGKVLEVDTEEGQRVEIWLEA
jgi:hypothetical protein